MLTPQQIAAAKATVAPAASASTVAPNQAMTPEQAHSWISQSAAPKPGILDTIGSAFHSGVDQAKAGYEDATKATNPVSKTEAGMKMLAGGVNVAFSPLAPAIAPIGTAVNAAADKLSETPLIKGAAGNTTVGPNGETNYIPNLEADRVTEDINNTATVLPLGAGIAAPKEIAGVVKGTVEKGQDLVDKTKKAMTPKPPSQGKVAIKDGKQLNESIKASMPLEDKNTRIDALRNTFPDTSNGGVGRKGILGKSTIEHSPEDIERGTTAHPYLKGEKDPVKQIANINQGIKDTSTGVDTFLDSKAAPSNFADMRNYMETNKPNASLQKDPGAADSYNRATQDALGTLYRTMKDSAKESGDFSEKTSGADIRKARIAIDQQISKELGENTFGTPQYKGIKAAEIDTRNLLNRMSEDMLRYPGQLAKLNRLNDFISSAKERGIEVDMKNPDVRSQLETQFELRSTPEAEADAQHLSNQHKTMSQLYETRDNIIDKYQSSLGKNRVQETIGQSPALKAGVGVAKRVIPFGIGTHL